MLNLEKLVYELLVRSLPDHYTVIPELDVSDGVDDFPLVTFTVTGGEGIDTDAGKSSAWDAGLTLSVFDDDMDDAIAVAGTVYDAVWSWDDPWAVGDPGKIPGLGRAAEIRDQSIFTRTGTVPIGAIAITQLVGEFGLQLHKA